MVGWKRVEFGVKVDIWGVDPDAGARSIQDIHICVHLGNRNSQCRATIHNRVFTEENDLTWSGRRGHTKSEMRLALRQIKNRDHGQSP